jgi:arylformamidase
MKSLVLASIILSIMVPLLSAQNGGLPPGWIDVSVAIDPSTLPVYPGDAPAKFKTLLSYDKGDKLALSGLDMGTHTGTHIDAPLHFIQGGATIDKIGLDQLNGPAIVIECSREAAVIDTAELNKHPEWRKAKRILFKTRNSYENIWDKKEFDKSFVAFAPDAAKLMADAGVQVVGIDYLSAEKFGATEPLAHRALLGKGIAIIEGLDLRPAKAGEYELLLLPLKVVGLEGAPARAILKSVR